MKTYKSIQAITLFTFLSILFTHCSESESTGFTGDWEGTTTRINTLGVPIESETKSTITTQENEYQISLDPGTGSNQEFKAIKSSGMLVYDNALITNQSSDSLQTYINGDVRLQGDSLLIFEHQVYRMTGNAVINMADFAFELKRKK